MAGMKIETRLRACDSASDFDNRDFLRMDGSYHELGFLLLFKGLWF